MSSEDGLTKWEGELVWTEKSFLVEIMAQNSKDTSFGRFPRGEVSFGLRNDIGSSWKG